MTTQIITDKLRNAITDRMQGAQEEGLSASDAYYYALDALDGDECREYIALTQKMGHDEADKAITTFMNIQ